MANDNRDASREPGQRQVSLQLDAGAANWTLAGGWCEPDTLGIKIAVYVPGTDEWREVEIRVPLSVDADGTLTIGEPEQADT